MTFTEGDRVDVAAPRYTGPGVLKKGTDESIIVWYDHMGIGLNVLVPNGNVWTYPALSVTLTSEAPCTEP
jgi:hypothetical protein